MTTFRDGQSGFTDYDAASTNPPPLNLPQRYHLLSIAIDKYRYDSPLQNAVKEAEKLKQVLSRHYGFDHCYSLYNERATKENIREALELYAANLGSDDALLIHYAGHGKANNLGNTAFKTYEAVPSRPDTWREHAGFIQGLQVIKARYILLLIDSCYAGGILTGSAPRGGGTSPDAPSASYVGRIAERTSRIALTSGGLEEVPDLSQFAKKIIGRLRDNQSPWLLSGNLLAAAQNSPVKTTPAIYYLDGHDQGAEFIFHRRDLVSPPAAPSPPDPSQENSASSDSHRLSKYRTVGSILALATALAFLFWLFYGNHAQGYLEYTELKRADEAAWKVALRDDNLTGYQRYLSDCEPVCGFQKHAKQRIKELRELENQWQLAELTSADESAWIKALSSDNLAGYESYLRDCNSVCAFQSDAEQRVRELRALQDIQLQAILTTADQSAWSTALKANNLAGYESYLRDCNSVCAFRSNAERRVRELKDLGNQQRQADLTIADQSAWSTALQANNLAGYESYLRDCNSVCAFRSNAERRVRELKDLGNQQRQADLTIADQSAWSTALQANNLAGYQSYLNACNSICAFRRDAERLVELMREFTLTIRSNVYLDEVQIDGKSYGSTPVRVKLRRGSYPVRVRKPGYKDYSKRIELTRARTLRVQLQRKDLALGEIIQDCPECPKMVYIPAGSFRMGDIQGYGHSYEKPVHRVSVGAFMLGQTEVTFAEWNACAAADVCSYITDYESMTRDSRRPVNVVSWEDITQQYIPWLNKKTGEQYRLPTEAEWEYAARAGSETKYFFGNSTNDLCRYANGAGSETNYSARNEACRDDYKNKNAPVASFGANAFGLYDMHGNVWELGQDCWNDSYEGAPDDGSAWLSGDCSKRVLRGGSRASSPYILRSAYRHEKLSNKRYGDTGFRIAKTLD